MRLTQLGIRASRFAGKKLRFF